MSMKEFWSTDLSWWCSSQRQVFPSPPPSSPPPPRCAGQTFKWSGFQILILWRPKLMCSAFKRWEKAMYHILAAHPLMLGLPFCFKFCLHPLLYFPSPLLFIFLPRFFLFSSPAFLLAHPLMLGLPRHFSSPTPSFSSVSISTSFFSHWFTFCDQEIMRRCVSQVLL